MNYHQDLDSVYTLAHELGHSAHSHLACKNQNFLNSNYSIFVAEVASTVNEELLTRHLLENSDSEDIKAHALSHSLENFRTTLFRQTMFAEFEHRAYRQMEEKMSMTPEQASELYADIKCDFYAPANLDDHIRKEWMRIPHFYYNFYVFQYATGISAAKQVAEQIFSGQKEPYLEMLRKGGSMYPLELLEVANIDMSSPKPIESATDIYRRRLEEMKRLVD
jgi:oligoendopeptidase F